MRVWLPLLKDGRRQDGWNRSRTDRQTRARLGSLTSTSDSSVKKTQLHSSPQLCIYLAQATRWTLFASDTQSLVTGVADLNPGLCMARRTVRVLPALARGAFTQCVMSSADEKL